MDYVFTRSITPNSWGECRMTWAVGGFHMPKETVRKERVTPNSRGAHHVPPVPMATLRLRGVEHCAQGPTVTECRVGQNVPQPQSPRLSPRTTLSSQTCSLFLPPVAHLIVTLET